MSEANTAPDPSPPYEKGEQETNDKRIFAALIKILDSSRARSNDFQLDGMDWSSRSGTVPFSEGDISVFDALGVKQLFIKELVTKSNSESDYEFHINGYSTSDEKDTVEGEIDIRPGTVKTRVMKPQITELQVPPENIGTLAEELEAFAKKIMQEVGSATQAEA